MTVRGHVGIALVLLVTLAAIGTVATKKGWAGWVQTHIQRAFT